MVRSLPPEERTNLQVSCESEAGLENVRLSVSVVLRYVEFPVDAFIEMHRVCPVGAYARACELEAGCLTCTFTYQCNPRCAVPSLGFMMHFRTKHGGCCWHVYPHFNEQMLVHADKHLDAEDGKSVDSTLTERDEGDNKADGPLSSRVSRAAAILVLCIIVAATTAIIRHGKAKSPATRGPWREQQDESTLQQLDEPSHDDKYLNATRDWTLFDDESVASSHLYSASTFDESSSTAQTNVSKQGAV